MTSKQTAADLAAGTRVMTPKGRMGTVNGYDIGRVTNPDHINYGREYVGVDLDPIEGDMGCGRRSRPFVDELIIKSTPRASEDGLAVAVNDGKTNCASHGIRDTRGGRAIELGSIPACEPGITYGAWSEGAGGFVYSGDCATEVANWAADELRQLAKEDDTDTFRILAICPDHEEQSRADCEDCFAV